MTNTSKFWLGLIVALLIHPFMYAQTLVNKVWHTSFGLPNHQSLIASTTDPGGNILATGNTQGSNSPDILIQKIAPNGSTLWTQTFNHPANLADYGCDILSDPTGNVLVAGGCENPSAGTMETVILKYSPAGTLLWTFSPTLSGYGNIQPKKAVLDGNDLVLLAQATSSNLDTDYLILKVSVSGNLLWSREYDYAGRNETPKDLDISPTSGHILVTGASETSSGRTELATLRINKNNGNLIGTHRLVNPALEFEVPAGLRVDSNGEAYVFGKAKTANQDFDLVVLKLNAGMGEKWVNYFDLEGEDEEGIDLAVDGNDNVWITGYATRSYHQTELLTLKYDRNGNLQWKNLHPALEGIGDAKGRKICLTDDGKAVVSGINSGNQTTVSTLQLDADGQKRWVKYFELPGNSSNISYDLMTGPDQSVYVSLESDNGNQRTYTTVKYQYWTAPFQVVADSLGTPQYMADEIIVKFDPALVNTVSVDNRDLLYGSYSDFLDAQTIADIEAKLNISTHDLKIRKIFRKLTTRETTSITRGGQTIPIPEFWSTLLLELPTGMDIEQAADSLATLSPKIWYAEPNAVATLDAVIPNDSLFDSTQVSLDTSDAGINAEGAWRFEVGNSSVKVGVYDTGIDWRHLDFGDSTFAGSKIKGGWDWENNQDISTLSNPDADGHGTACAGIIGALRNNNRGIAGIAGGDVDDFNNTGCELYAMKIFSSGGTLLTWADIADAVVLGASNNPSVGYGLHVMSNSYSGEDKALIMVEAVDFAHKNEVVFVASRGNTGNDLVQFPACFHDDQVLSVGASALNGFFQDFQPPETDWGSSFGKGIDFVAPGIRRLVHTVQSNTQNSYREFSGTSAAAPHVAGIAALLLSYYNDPQQGRYLAPEDVEHLIQLSTEDLDAPGYGNETGWGRVDAGNTLENIEIGKFTIEHHSFNQNGSNLFITTMVASNQLMVLNKSFGSVPAGSYFMDVWKVTVEIPHTPTAGWNQISGWARNSSSNLYGFDSPISQIADAEIQNITPNSATMVGYIYEIKSNLLGQPINTWMPFSPSDARTQTQLAYSLYLKNTRLSREEADDFSDFQLFPNPTTNEVTVAFTSPEKDVTISIVDLTGRKVWENENPLQGLGNKYEVKIPLNGLPAGAYICTIQAGSSVFNRKLIKTQ